MLDMLGATVGQFSLVAILAFMAMVLILAIQAIERFELYGGKKDFFIGLALKAFVALLMCAGLGCHIVLGLALSATVPLLFAWALRTVFEMIDMHGEIKQDLEILDGMQNQSRMRTVLIDKCKRRGLSADAISMMLDRHFP